MESYTILAEAARYGVPSVAVRAISDTADFDMPYDFESTCDGRGQIRISRMVMQMLRRPVRVARDAHVGAQFAGPLRGISRISWILFLRGRFPTGCADPH